MLTRIHGTVSDAHNYGAMKQMIFRLEDENRRLKAMLKLREQKIRELTKKEATNEQA